MKYPVVDKVSLTEQTQLKMKSRILIGQYGGIHAVNTGEFREPKAGEWFLSGSPVEAYKAVNDLTMKYYIAELRQGPPDKRK